MKFLLYLFPLLVVLSASASTNLIPNSSFEAGSGRGWLPYQTGNSSAFGNRSFISGLLTNIAFHGGTSIIVPIQSRLMSRMIWLTNGTYCLSYYGRTASGSAGSAFKAGLLRGPELYTTEPPAQNGNMTGSWARYSTNYVVTSNQWHWVKFYHGGADVFIDAVQLELGTSPTTYAPQSTVECGIVLGGTYGMFFSGQAPVCQLTFRNESAGSTNARVEYQVFDAWNSNLVTTTVSIPCAAATNTSTTITLPTRTGWMSIRSRLLDFPDSADEAHTVFYPYASNFVGNATTDWLGGHPYASDFHVTRELLVGRKFGRTLSPNYFNTRWDVVEPTRGNMTFLPYIMSNYWAHGMIVIGTLTPSDTSWPSWATNTSAMTNSLFPAIGSADLMAFSNFCYFAVLTNKTYCTNWEVGPNEPYQSGPTGFGPYDGNPISDQYAGATNLPINVRVATNYAKCLAYGIAGITNADPTAKIIGIAGAYGDGVWALEAWNALSANLKSWVFAVSTHIYAEDQRYDPNDPFYTSITASFSYPLGWVNTFVSLGLQVWNTESAAYGAGYMQGLNGLFPRQDTDHPGTYDSVEDWAAEGWTDSIRNESLSRQVTETTRILTTALRCIGFGFSKYIYYDSREFNDASYQSTQPYPSDYLQVDRPELVALSVAQSFVRRGFGPITNATAVPLEMYMFTNGLGQSVVAPWSADRLFRTLTFTNGFMAQYDCMGNQMQTNSLTARVSRVPTYFVSGTLSVVQLSNTFKFASVATVADVLPPQISIDVAPTGTSGWDTNRQLFKWTAVDDRCVAWPTNSETALIHTATNVLYRWKFDGDSYNSWNQSNHVWKYNLTPSNHFFYVSAKDTNDNVQEVRYEFSTPLTNTTVLNVNSVANIGQITIQP